MALPVGVYRRGGGPFWLRVGVPKGLQHLYPNKDRYRQSLRTSDRHEAAALALSLWAQFQNEFLQKRKGLKPQPIRPPAPLQAVIAQAVYAAEVAADERQRADKRLTVRMVSGVHVGMPEDGPEFPVVPRLSPLPSATVTARAAFHQTRLEWVKRAMAADDLGVMVPIATKAAQVLGLVVEWDSEEGAATLRACLAAYLRAREVAVQRDAGAVVETPAAPGPVAAPEIPVAPGCSPAPAKLLRLRDMVPDWRAKRQPKADALKCTERALRLLEASEFNKPLEELSRVHGAKFRDWLRAPEQTFKHKTAKNYWAALVALLNIAAEYGHIERNPWTGVDFLVLDSEERGPFTTEELGTIFGSELFKAGSYRAHYAVQPWDAYFMLLLGLWTGARVGELGQLECADVGVTNGIPMVSIHGDAEGSKVKTAGSVREVPVSEELVRLGFLAYVKTNRDAGQVKAFPSLHRGGAVPPGGVMGEWFLRYRKELGLAEGSLNGFHRFRHTIRSALAANNIAPETGDALTGHAASGSTGRKVYTHIALSTVRDALRVPLFPSLRLERIFPV